MPISPYKILGQVDGQGEWGSGGIASPWTVAYRSVVKYRGQGQSGQAIRLSDYTLRQWFPNTH